MRGRGSYVAAHAYSPEAIEHSVTHGIRSIEHGNLLLDEPTAEVLDVGQRAVEIALHAGVSVGFGTDLMGSLETEQLSGLRLQSQAVGAYQTLRSATSVNADLGRPDLGGIAPGAAADLVLVDGDPLADISVLADPEAAREIWRGGVVKPVAPAGR